MKARDYEVLKMAVENGVHSGWARSRKHTDSPDPHDVMDAIYRGVMESICEWFDFDEDGT